MPISGLLDIRISPFPGVVTQEKIVYLNPKSPFHWRSVITTTINHFTTMISVLPECPANQIFLSLLNTPRGVILTLSFQVSNQDTEGRDTWGIREGHAGQLWAMGAVNPGVIWLQHFPL